MKTILVLFTFVLTFVQPARADQLSNELRVLEASLSARDSFITALQKKDFTAVAQQAMGGSIAIFADELIATKNDTTAAAELKTIWEKEKGAFYTVSFRDVGDHAPLIPELEAFFGNMAKKYGRIILTLPIVQDIRTLNFSIPVVFHPKGAWQSAEYDNRIEYRKHFIPFANIVTYYGSLIACNYVASQSEDGGQELKKHCKKAAEQLKFAMGRYIAPKISDWIFKQSNKPITITQQNRRYNTAEELNDAIKKAGATR